MTGLKIFSIERFHPAYFALVMATGIVSIASRLLGLPFAANMLFWLNLFFYAALVLITVLRIAWFPSQVRADLSDHQRGVGFFTVVAGTAVLGSQFLIIQNSPEIAFGLWVLSTSLWLLLTYAIFSLLTVKREKPTLAAGIHGGWLVSVVATQSVSVLAALLAPSLPSHDELLLFFALVTWLGGGMLYIWIMTLIFYRYTFFPMSPTDLAPPYWINMGAMAISTLAGALLSAGSRDFSLLVELLPFLKGMTLLFWSTATGWIPLLLVLGAWRHIPNKVPITYDPVYWSAVFPLGMYTVCTYRLSEALSLPALMLIPRISVYFALLAWCITAFGLLLRILRGKPTP